MSELVQSRLIAERPILVRGVENVIGITFDIHPGWHLYWENPGDSGGPIRVKLSVPEGLTVLGLDWPAPEWKAHSGLVDFVYEGSATLLARVAVAPDAPLEPATIRATLDWVVCEDVCLFGNGQVELTLPIVARADSVERSPDAARIDAARSRLPRPETDGGEAVRTTWDGSALVLSAPGAAGLRFFPRSPLDVATVDILRDGQTLGDRLRVEYKADITSAERVTGVLEVNRAGAVKFHLIDIAGPETG